MVYKMGKRSSIAFGIMATSGILQRLNTKVCSSRKRNRDDADRHTASHSRSKTAIKPRSKLQRNSKPLLHQVLRTAGFKNQRESLMPAKQLDYISEEADVLNNTATTVKLVQRQPLVPADPNMQAGKGSLLKDQKDV